MSSTIKLDLEDPKLIKVAKVKCLKSILFHTRFFFNTHNNRKFIVGDHHVKICDALERVLTGHCKRLIINVAPRYTKTELAVKSFISHGLSLNPKAKFIHLSYGDDIALDNSEAIKDLVESEEYQKLFPEVQIKNDAKAKNKWYTTKGGGVLARAAGGQVTGFGAGLVDDDDNDFFDFIDLLKKDFSRDPLEDKFDFNGAIIIDDPIKPEDADQDTIREKVNSRFDSTIRNRVNSRNTPIIVIMQRLHPMDLTGYLTRKEEADQWEVLSLPCLIPDDNGEEVLTDEYDESGKLIQVKKKWRALWPHKHTVQELLALKKSNDVVFERQNQQDPSPKTGLLFPLQDLKKFNYHKMAKSLVDCDFTLVCADPADEGGDDFAAGVFKLLDNKIYLTEVLYNTDGADHNEVALSDLIMKDHNKTNDVAVEGVLGWKETAIRIRDNLTRKGYKKEFRIVRPRKQKHSRILNRSSFIRNNIWFREDYMDFPQYAKFMRILTSYLRVQEAGKSNKHDDAPDLCEMSGAYFEKNFTHLW